jgi:hypothetical protein
VLESLTRLKRSFPIRLDVHDVQPEGRVHALIASSSNHGFHGITCLDKLENGG